VQVRLAVFTRFYKVFSGSSVDDGMRAGVRRSQTTRAGSLREFLVIIILGHLGGVRINEQIVSDAENVFMGYGRLASDATLVLFIRVCWVQFNVFHASTISGGLHWDPYGYLGIGKLHVSVYVEDHGEE
jgi:hypothetical protein